MRTKTWVIVAGMMVIYAAFTLLGGGGVEQRVAKLFETHRAELAEQMAAYEEGGFLTGAEHWKGVTEWDGVHKMVEYTVTAAGSTYYGFYYSPDDVPLAFQNTDTALTESDGGWVWQAEGDNHGRTYRLAEDWFYFEATL